MRIVADKIVVLESEKEDLQLQTGTEYKEKINSGRLQDLPEV